MLGLIIEVGFALVKIIEFGYNCIQAVPYNSILTL